MQALLNHICCGLRTFLRHPVIPQQTTSDTVSTTNKAFCCIPQTQATPGCDNAYAVSDKPCQTRAGIVQQLNSQAETNAPMLVADDAYTVRCISINTIWHCSISGTTLSNISLCKLASWHAQQVKLQMSRRVSD